MDYRVQLEAFHGPLDLLLYLVRKNEVDILDIPIAQIAEQFQDYLRVLQVADVERAGDFLVMAATLMEIKSKMLLPAAAANPEPDVPDPRQELVKQLVEYKKFKEAAAVLETRAVESRQRLPRQPAVDRSAAENPRTVQGVELWDLVSAFGRLLSETATLEPSRIIADDTPQAVYVEQLERTLADRGRIRFREAFAPPFHRVRLVGLFLALLEMIRAGAATLEQDGLFGEIWLCHARGNYKPLSVIN